MTEATKPCTKCGIVKPLTEFHAGRKSRPGTHRSRCKECERQVRAEYRARNREELRRKGREYAANNRDKMRERSRAWYYANKERVLEQSRAWHKNNPDKASAKAAAFRARNAEVNRRKARERYWADPQKAQAISRKHRNAHKERIRARERELRNNDAFRFKDRIKAAKRRALKRRNGVFVLSQRDLRRLMEASNCYLCGTALDGANKQVDHIIPLSRGGRHSVGNLAAACDRCNLSKQSRTPSEFRIYLRRVSAA
jgi:5-methylcytosine-specific restriction endonuclease McrA